MNILQIHKVLTKRVKYFQGLIPLDITTCTLIKQLIISLTLKSITCPVRIGSCLLFRLWLRRILVSYGQQQFKLEIMA